MRARRPTLRRAPRMCCSPRPRPSRTLLLQPLELPQRSQATRHAAGSAHHLPPFGPRGSTVSGRHFNATDLLGSFSMKRETEVTDPAAIWARRSLGTEYCPSFVRVCTSFASAWPHSLRDEKASLAIHSTGGVVPPYHSAHAHSAAADVATASREQNAVTTRYGQRVVMSAPFSRDPPGSGGRSSPGQKHRDQ